MSAVPGYQIGLKVWSVNTGVCQREARRLYDAGVYDYLELYAVPGTADTLPGWKALGIPCVVHAAHFKHGFNLAREDCTAANRRIYDEMRRFADELGARYIIFHGGTFGCIPGILAPGAMLTIETTRTCPEALEEFKREVEHFRTFAENSYVAEALQAGIDMQVKSC